MIGRGGEADVADGELERVQDEELRRLGEGEGDADDAGEAARDEVELQAEVVAPRGGERRQPGSALELIDARPLLRHAGARRNPPARALGGRLDGAPS